MTFIYYLGKFQTEIIISALTMKFHNVSETKMRIYIIIVSERINSDFL